MSEVAPDPAADSVGPGRLVLVVGPSGAGKDTLIALAAIACAEDPGIRFPPRVVTREASLYEDNTALTPDDFAREAAAGGFSLWWTAHGHSYGVPVTIEDDIRAGRTVVVNVSRTIVGAARTRFAHIIVVCVTAPADILAARLEARGRPSDGAIGSRLERATMLAGVDADVVIVNTNAAVDHALELLQAIRNH